MIEGLGGMFDDLAQLFGVGSWPEPPDHLPLRILGLSEGASREAVVKAFRKKLLEIHPDLRPAFENPDFREWAQAGRGDLPDVQELVWARDCALRKIPEPVTSNGSTAVSVTKSVTDRPHFKAESGKAAICRNCGGELKPPERINLYRRSVELYCDACAKREDWIPDHRCVVCGVVMIGQASRCSETCDRKAASEARRKRRAWRRGKKICQTCGERFEPTRTDAKYCSAACRQRAYRVSHA
jgi:predicted nucleic acid-binding Zn ribbon protein